MLSVFYGEDIDNTIYSIEFINNTVTADSEGKLALMVAGQRLALPRFFFERLYLGKDTQKEPFV